MSATLLRKRLKDGETLFGTLIVSESPRWMDVLPGCDLDFVFIDTEHVALDRNKLSWMCHGYAAIGLPPLVRIPSPDPFSACMVLDGGAGGVIAPYVETVEQVRKLTGATKYRPIKGKKLDGLLNGEEMEPDLEEYVSKNSNQHILIINVESVDGIKALDDLVRVPGLDGILIGPHDLSCSLGIPEQYDHPDFLAACETIFSKARSAGLGAGIHFWGDTTQQARFIEMGANFLIHSADILLFKKHLTAEIKAIKQAIGSSQDTLSKSGDINI